MAQVDPNGEIFPALLQLEDEKPKAYEAFLTYIGLGPGRSLHKMLQFTHQTGKGEKRLYNMRGLAEWSTKNKWQERLANYLKQVGAHQSKLTREKLIEVEQLAWDDFYRLHEMIEEQRQEYTKLRVTKRTRQKDPRDKSGNTEIETVYMKVNTTDLERLVRTFGLLMKDLRSHIGADGKTTSISFNAPTGTTGAIKAYIGFNPDEWPDAEITPEGQNRVDTPGQELPGDDPDDTE